MNNNDFLARDVFPPRQVGMGKHMGIPYYWSLVPHPTENKLTNAVITADRRIFIDSTSEVFRRGRKTTIGEDEIVEQFNMQYLSPMLDQQAVLTWNPKGSPHSIQEFVSNKKLSVPLAEAYKDLLGENQKFIYHYEPMFHKLIVLKVLETYFHKIFNAMGKVHMQGEKNSGKTTQSRMFSYYGFNPVSVAMCSEAAFRRVMNAISGTLCLDDQDDISDDFKKFLNRSIKIGYTQGMSKAMLTKMNGKGEIEIFDMFFPVVTNGIIEVDHVAATREYIIYMLRAGEERPELLPNPELHDKLYLMGLCNWEQVEKMYKTTTLDKRYYGRLREIALPILSMAKLIEKQGGEKGLYEEMSNFVFSNYTKQMEIYENEDYFFRCISVALEEILQQYQDYITIRPKESAMRIIDGDGHSADKERKGCAYIIGKRLKGLPNVFASKYPNGRAEYVAEPAKLVRFAQSRGWDALIPNFELIEDTVRSNGMAPKHAKSKDEQNKQDKNNESRYEER